ncbi:hypothetical protein B0H14DRAFT_3602756 [Mycena olivaceomarginata]|nr:hypothetical protein B0H14DRAFT_3602756 [Mycena olivaceomarginata]
MASSENADIRPVTENDSCFTDFLKEQKEQTSRLVEELRPKHPPTTDKKTAFWNAYKTLADEHDKELLHRYSTDLDTSLIFAGLFSAVDSAFIIQIQPEIQPHGARPIVIFAQCLLYISLFSTLLASLLAVLGKQWLMYYSAAGEKGSIEVRGLEWQRKLDGLVKWKFEAVIQIFPLLLQLALFLFWAALSIYLRTIHPSIAGIVLVLALCGFIAYCFLLRSAVMHKDSPFQTPLASVLLHLTSTKFWEKSRAIVKQITKPSYAFWTQIHSTASPYFHRLWHLLPHFRKQCTQLSKSEKPTALLDISLLKPSPEVSAVSWVLETSTDPIMVLHAASLVPELQWPSSINVQSQISRVWESFLACFWYALVMNNTMYYWLRGIRDGMHDHIIQLGCAYHVLCCVDPLSSLQLNTTLSTTMMLDPELHNIIHLAGNNPSSLKFHQAVYLKWVLHVLPLQARKDHDANIRSLESILQQLSCNTLSLNFSEFSDYLFCVTAFLLGGEIGQSDLVWMDKRQLLTTIISKLQSNQISMDIAANILHTTHRLESSSKDNHLQWKYPDDLSSIYEFCSNLPRMNGWVNVVLAIGTLINTHWKSWDLDLPGTADWIYEVLKSDSIPVEDSVQWDDKLQAGVAGLLLALQQYRIPLPKDSIYLILRALQVGGHVSELARDVLVVTTDWFQDPELEPILRNASVWVHLSKGGLPESLPEAYVVLGHALAQMLDWQPQLYQEGLGSWINAFFSCWQWQDPNVPDKYIYVLTKLFKQSTRQYSFIDTDEQALGLTYVALSDIWGRSDFSTASNVEELVLWLHCSLKVLASKTAQKYVITAQNFKETFHVPLQNLFIKVAVAVRQTATCTQSSEDEDCLPVSSTAIQKVAEILEDLQTT